MRFLVISVLIVATIMALTQLTTAFKDSSGGFHAKPSSALIPTTSSNQAKPLVLTPISSPTPTPSNLSFDEMWAQVKGQDVVYFVPKNLNPTQTLGLVVYAHGSREVISAGQETSEEILKLKKYALKLSLNNFILVASNMHGENWGSSESVEDLRLLVNFITDKYPAIQKVDLWGFSMGGLPTMLYTVQNPSKVEKIALFAPTVDISFWNAEKVKLISSIPIKVWHGQKDQNVPFKSSQEFLKKLISHGVLVEFKPVKGAGHFDLEDVGGLVEFFKK